MASPMTFRLRQEDIRAVETIASSTELYALADRLHSGTGGIRDRRLAGSVLAALATIVARAERESGHPPHWWVGPVRGELRWEHADTRWYHNDVCTIGRALSAVLPPST